MHARLCGCYVPYSTPLVGIMRYSNCVLCAQDHGLHVTIRNHIDNGHGIKKPEIHIPEQKNGHWKLLALKNSGTCLFYRQNLKCSCLGYLGSQSRWHGLHVQLPECMMAQDVHKDKTHAVHNSAVGYPFQRHVRAFTGITVVLFEDTDGWWDWLLITMSRPSKKVTLPWPGLNCKIRVLLYIFESGRAESGDGKHGYVTSLWMPLKNLWNLDDRTWKQPKRTNPSPGTSWEESGRVKEKADCCLFVRRGIPHASRLKRLN